MRRKLGLLCAVSMIIGTSLCIQGGETIVYPDSAPALGVDIFGVSNSLFPTKNVSLTNNSVTVKADLTGHVFGGMSDGTPSPQNVTNNTVLVTNATIGGSPLLLEPQLRDQETGALLGLTVGGVFGGATLQGNSDSNQVTIAGAHIAGSVYGGYVSYAGGTASSNVVQITEGTVEKNVVGGFTYVGDSNDNKVTIANSSLMDWVYGGFSQDTGNALRNSVTITGSSISSSVSGFVHRVYGGISWDGDSSENTVKISGVAADAFATTNIFGGSSQDGKANGNAVTISDSPGFRSLFITGGISQSGVEARNNSVSIINSPNFAVGLIRGGRLTPAGGENAGNTLNLIGSGGTATGIHYFENYNFYLPATLGAGGTLVTITGATATDMTGTNIAITGYEGGGTVLQPGESITLISKATGPVDFHTLVPKGNLLVYDFRVFTDGALKAELASASVTPGGNVLPDGPAAAIGFLGQGADLVAGMGAIRILEPEERRKMPTIFAVATGGDVHYKVGSHVDVKGVNILTGLDWYVPAFCGGLNLAAFFEAGWGDYDSNHSFGNLSSVRGEGNTNYYGGGLLARLDFQNGLYVEGSGRAGGSEVKFKSSDVRDAFGNIARYDYTAPYYGAHAGLGYIWKLNEKSSLDLYSKYLWARLSSKDVTVLGEPVHFDTLDSQRLRAGARYSYAASNCLSLYAGAAYEYEFSAKANGAVYGYDFIAPSLKGGSGVGELGLFYRKGNWSSELGAKGYVGRREGVTGRLMLGYDF